MPGSVPSQVVIGDSFNLEVTLNTSFHYVLENVATSMTELTMGQTEWFVANNKGLILHRNVAFQTLMIRGVFDWMSGSRCLGHNSTASMIVSHRRLQDELRENHLVRQSN